MLRRLILLFGSVLLVLAPSAAAGDVMLPIRVFDSVDIELLLASDQFQIDDPVGDIYHPAGTPGSTTDNIDIASVEMATWAMDLERLLTGSFVGPGGENPFDSELSATDDIHRAGPDDFGIGTPYVAARIELVGDLDSTGDWFCEYPVAWRVPGLPVFEGISGDLFNGANRVAVARMGPGVPNGFQAASLDFGDAGWQETDARAFAAAAGNEVLHVIPASEFGTAGDGLRQSIVQFMQSVDETETTVDFNFGAFCSSGGLSFDPALGGVDILQGPVDLAALPVSIVGPPPPPAVAPTTTTATTAAASPVTSVASEATTESGGGVNPALVALIVGGLGAAAYAAAKTIDRDDSDRNMDAFQYRIEIDGGVSVGFTTMTGLDFDPASIEYRQGAETGTTTKQPGLAKHANLHLSGGFSDASVFEDWVQGGANDPRKGSVFARGPGFGFELKFEKAWPIKMELLGPGANVTESVMESVHLRVEGLELRPK